MDLNAMLCQCHRSTKPADTAANYCYVPEHDGETEMNDDKTRSVNLLTRISLMLSAGATLLFVVLAFIAPEHRWVSLFFVLIGLLGTWRLYTQLRKRK
jgi:hypothetical protein